MQNSRMSSWERWYQGVGYAAVGLSVALVMIVLVASSELPWYLYMPPVFYALLSVERLAQAIRRRRTGSQ
jgi:type IV secretory pathway VirB3-like protein